MYNYFKKINFVSRHFQKGMTLIELIVVIAIFTILMGVTIFDYSSFRSSVSLDNLASDIALSIRKAQSYAIGVRGSSSSFDQGYGISFVKSDPSSNTTSGSNKSFIIFTDSNNNNKYDIPDASAVCGSSGNECKEVLSIPGINKISAIYLKDTDNITQLNNNGRIDIVFKRPNPDAKFCYRPGGATNACTSAGGDFNYVVIEVSDDRNVRYITIWNTGQISMNTDEIKEYSLEIIPV